MTNADTTGGSPTNAAVPQRHWHLVVRHKHPEWHGHCPTTERTGPFSGEEFTSITHTCERNAPTGTGRSDTDTRRTADELRAALAADRAYGRLRRGSALRVPALRPGAHRCGAGIVTANPRLLDLFCCEGGAGTGYARAGFDVFGVDMSAGHLRRYPFQSVQADALEYLSAVIADGTVRQFAAIHASPPCQSESDLRWVTGEEYPDLLGPTLALLADVDVPWVVENVSTTKQLPGALVLCGSEFNLTCRDRHGVVRVLKRHRRFGSNVFLLGAGGCSCSGRPVMGVYGNGGGGQMTRGYKATIGEAREVMGMPWASRRGVSEAIPPAYTEFIGGQLLSMVDREAVAS